MTLADLLRGKEEVLTVLKSDNSEASADLTENQPVTEFSVEIKETETKESGNEKSLENLETKYEIKSATEIASTTDTMQNVDVELTTELNAEQPISEKPKVEDISRRPYIRKFSTATRRKQRIRPMMNTTYKSQLSRDMIALNARRYFNNRKRNSQEWKDLGPIMKKNVRGESANKKTEETTTVHYSGEETTLQDVDNCTKLAEPENDQNDASENFDDIEVSTKKSIVFEAKPNIVQRPANVTEKPTVQSTTTQALNASGLRRQAFNNRLKKKRLKQKNLTTEPPQDDIMMNLYGIPNLVSSSEFISQTQWPKTSLDDVTILEESITTEMPHRHESRTKTTKYSLPRTSTAPHTIFIPIPTKETAKIEIEEIFNDTQSK